MSPELTSLATSKLKRLNYAKTLDNLHLSGAKKFKNSPDKWQVNYLLLKL